jgi:uncharacterized protein (TIGR03437 family)
LSGDGSLAYAGTPNGRILRFSVPSGKMDEVSGATPQLNGLQTVAVGSVTWVLGTALSDGTHPMITAGDREAPVISAQPSLVKFQIPWETPVDEPVEVRLAYGPPPPFESVLTITTATINAAFLAQPVVSSDVLAYHQDFRSFVTPSDPAQPGEIIHFYMSGLGPVTNPLATGQRTPTTGPLHKAIYPPICGVSLTGLVTVNAPIRFAGLAPGYVGLYQMDVEVPEGLVLADSQLGCSVPARVSGGFNVFQTDLYVRVP